MSWRELLFGFSATTIAKHPECFTTSTIDRHACTRTVPMLVLSLGFSRTGTASMHAALTLLGIPTYHGFHMYSNIPDTDMWREAFERKYFDVPGPPLDREFFDKLLGHVSAVTDLPAVAFSTELIAAYPEARVVLVKREIESWYRSFHSVFVTAAASQINPWVAWLDPSFTGKLWRLAKDGIARGQFGAEDAGEFARNAREVYERHYATVRKSMQAKEENLLEFRLVEGWEPLCGFLGTKAPSVPFPRVNETKIMEEKIKVLVIRGLRRAGSKARRFSALPVAAFGIAMWWAWSS